MARHEAMVASRDLEIPLEARYYPFQLVVTMESSILWRYLQVVKSYLPLSEIITEFGASITATGMPGMKRLLEEQWVIGYFRYNIYNVN